MLRRRRVDLRKTGAVFKANSSRPEATKPLLSNDRGDRQRTQNLPCFVSSGQTVLLTKSDAAVNLEDSSSDAVTVHT